MLVLVVPPVGQAVAAVAAVCVNTYLHCGAAGDAVGALVYVWNCLIMSMGTILSIFYKMSWIGSSTKILCLAGVTILLTKLSNLSDNSFLQIHLKFLYVSHVM